MLGGILLAVGATGLLNLGTIVDGLGPRASRTGHFGTAFTRTGLRGARISSCRRLGLWGPVPSDTTGMATPLAGLCDG
ncbi:hypothetical protein GCM10025880_29420 [Methylorubrum aminovorans]|nr:hypothetical protein GCM10025880_29420 [Methylorubrum aminovorans]